MMENMNSDDELLVEDDFLIYMATVCKLHPGLEFLRPTPDF